MRIQYNYKTTYVRIVYMKYVWLFFGGYAWINNTRDPLCVMGDEIVRQLWSQLPLVASPKSGFKDTWYLRLRIAPQVVGIPIIPSSEPMASFSLSVWFRYIKNG